MREEMEGLKNIRFIEEKVTIKSSVKEADEAQFEKLAEALLK